MCKKSLDTAASPRNDFHMQYYVLTTDNQIEGPYAAASMLEMQQAGALTADTPAAAAGDTSWVPFCELLPAIREDMNHGEDSLDPADYRGQVRAARKSGPPTLPVLVRLLKEDCRQFPRPRNKQPSGRP